MLILLPLMLVAAVDADLSAGQKKMEAFEYEAAVALFDKAAHKPAASDKDKATALVWLGLAYAELRDNAKASLAFEDAVRKDPLVVLPSDASPKIKQLLDEARARVAARGDSTTSTPPPPPPPAEVTPPAKVDPPTPPPAKQASVLPVVGLGVAGVGGAVLIAGAVTWGIGVALYLQGSGTKFQSDAVAVKEPSEAAQLYGQIAAGAGAAVAAAGVVTWLVTAE